MLVFGSKQEVHLYKFLFDLSSIDNTIHHLAPGVILEDFSHSEPFEARYIKVVGYNMGECPDDHKCGWHNGDGYIFADEIVID